MHEISYEPARLNGLLAMKKTQDGAHLQNFLCAMQWVKNGVHSFSKIVDALKKFMERV